MPLHPSAALQMKRVLVMSEQLQCPGPVHPFLAAADSDRSCCLVRADEHRAAAEDGGLCPHRRQGQRAEVRLYPCLGGAASLGPMP